MVQGSVRARQQRYGDRSGRSAMAVVIHGDSSFAGQGVVMETFNMSALRGYRTQGTVHIIVNNQIGFTTSHVKDARSTMYCTDVAKMVNAPIFHVNGDDPEAVFFVTQVALDYRMEFGKDVVIDLVCYRRHGHNEADEPSATQPVMYHEIRSMPTTRERYVEQLAALNIIAPEEAEAMARDYRDRLDAGSSVTEGVVVNNHEGRGGGVDWAPYMGREWDEPVDTCVDLETLRMLSERLQALPAGFELHPRVAKIMDDRRKMAGGRTAGGLGLCGVARVRDPAQRWLSHPPVRAGQRTRHLFSSPCGAAQPDRRRYLDAVAEPLGASSRISW